ncbi:MAG: polymorphic toxin-type HINT domain-containing protein [Planctomycetota bacterium]
MANGESVTCVVVSATVGVVAGKVLGKARGRGNSDADGGAPRDASDKPAPPPTTSPEPAKVDKVAPSDPPSANVDAGDAGGGPMFFPAGTLVSTPAGDVPIEEIAAGCVVYGYDDETLVATPAHLVWVESQRDWIAAKSLEVGMELRLLSGGLPAVREVRVRGLEAPEATYNFEVREVHDYFVRHLAVLVHNECVGAAKGEVDKFGNPISRDPKSIQDQMTLDAAKRGEGVVKIDSLGDPDYKGWEKMELETVSEGGKKSNVHYNRNPETGETADFKFMKHSTDYIHKYEKVREGGIKE